MRARAGCVAVVLVCVLASPATSAVTDGVLAGPGKGDGPVTGTAVFQANDGPSVAVDGGRWINWTDTVASDGATRLNLTYGGVLVADGDTGASLTVPNGEFLNESAVTVREIDTTGDVVLEPDHIQSVTVGKSIENVTWRSTAETALDDGTVDFSYGGPSGSSKVVLGGLPASRIVKAVDDNTGATLDRVVTNGSGYAAFSDLPNSDHDVTLQSGDGGVPEITDITPSGGQTTVPSTLSFWVNDSAFSSSFGDSVNVTATIDGSTVIDTTITSNTELSASIPASGQIAGEHTIEITANDSYGNDETAVATYKVPDQIISFNATEPTIVISSSAQYTFYAPDGETTTKTGSPLLTGLGATGDIAVRITADGYYGRTTFLETIFGPQRAYLIGKEHAVANVVFKLDDETGEFPTSESVILIQRPIERDHDGDGNDETKYETVSGDRFDAAGEFAATLLHNTRYRIIVKNGDGDQRLLGQYTATGDAVSTLKIGEIQLSADGPQGYAAGLETFTADRDEDGYDEQWVRVTYTDPDELTSTLSYDIRYADNGTQIVSHTVTNTLGSHVATYKVAENTTNSTYQLTYNATRNGQDISGIKYAGDVDGIDDELPIDPWWLTIIGLVGIVAIGGLLVLVDPALGALGATGAASVFSILGIVTIPMPALGLAGAISVIALVGRS